MKYKAVATLLFLTGLLIIASNKIAYSTTTINYGNLTLTSPGYATSWSDVWDLAQGDLTLDYTIDMTGAAQPWPWATSYTEVGIRTEGCEKNFNPGLWDAYQGSCGGWMTSLYGDLTPSPGAQSLFEKHNLQASGGRDERDYDCLVPNTVVAPFGTGDNYGIWFDRDTLDPYQATYWGSVDGGTYNTGGIYHIIIHYHAISPSLGSMFATVNGIQTGFWTAGWKNAQPEIYPAGISFKGDMSRMQVFAGLWAPSAAYGYVVIQDLKVTGEPGVSNPLIVDFTYIQSMSLYTVHFTDTSHGGSTTYASWAWDFNGDAITDSTLQNPSWNFLAPGDYNVKLTVTDHYGCPMLSVTKKISASATVGGEWTPITMQATMQTNPLQLATPWIALVLLAVATAGAASHRLLKKHW